MARRRLTKPAIIEGRIFGGGRAADVLADKMKNLDRKTINKLCALFNYASSGIMEIERIQRPGFRTLYKQSLMTECMVKLNNIEIKYKLPHEIFTYMMNVITRHMKKEKQDYINVWGAGGDS